MPKASGPRTPVKSPKEGDQIYVRSHQDEDGKLFGGLATVEHSEEISDLGKTIRFVAVKEHPGVDYNWAMLSKEQAKLKKKFGNQKACFEYCSDDDP